MLAVCDSACCLAASRRDSTSPHHLTEASASAKSWSVESCRFTPRIAASAVVLNSARLDAVTSPRTSMRSAGSKFGARPVATAGGSAGTM
jgi:hypothetical protein